MWGHALAHVHSTMTFMQVLNFGSDYMISVKLKERQLGDSYKLGFSDKDNKKTTFILFFFVLESDILTY
jgi:hypothetical protein